MTLLLAGLVLTVAAVSTSPAFGVDAVTVNEALNVCQLAVLLALLKWVRGGKPPR